MKNINKILLVVPPALTLDYYRDIAPLPPMGLGYLASIAEGLGIKVKIVDFLARGWHQEDKLGHGIIRIGSSDEEIKEYIREFDPDLIGITCQFSRQNKMYHHMFSLIKSIKPECLTLAGGAHVTVCPEEILNSPFCDYIICGEGERTFERLISALEKKEDLSLIDGLGWKSGAKLFINEKREWIKDLDSLPFPAYHLMELERYFGLKSAHGLRHKNKFSSIVTSRGCFGKCAFCSAKKAWGNIFRARSVGNIIKEMKKLKSEYGIEELLIEDDNVTADPKRAKELFTAMIRENIGLTWDTPNGVGVWSLDEELISLMKDAGCLKLNFPLESGSQEVVDRIIKKPVRLIQARKLIEYCRKIELDYGIFLVVGMPGEKIKDIWQSFRFAAKCKCFNPSISVATPYPGSELFEECVKNGYFVNNFSFDGLFTRGFMIRTKDWSPNQLRRAILWGELYLKWRKLLSEPAAFFKKAAEYIINPLKIISYFSKYKCACR